ncbi:MAG: GrpB family protein [Leptolyngbyaceae cyanobacterium SL_5_9]|nr:GrpB family protein [Leptolyngbyaceae cyanobacterium SL_5_9]
MIDEPIYLEKHDPLWKQQFIREQERIRIALQIDPTVIQHIGSTAISNICVKPIIDIMIGAETFPPLQHWINGLTDLNYEAIGEAGVPGRLYFRYRGLQSFNVHLVQREERHWKSNLALRDYLRADPQEAERYEKVKMKAVQSGVSSLLRYSQVKSEIIEELLSKALKWLTETN